jgi:L-lactate dehydrogenase complex protein LldG
VEQHTTSKEKILKKVRQALMTKSKGKFINIDLDSNVYLQPDEGESIYETFAKQFTSLAGQFVICDNPFDFIDKLLTLIERKKLKQIFCWEDAIQHQLKEAGIAHHTSKENIDKMQVAITGCEALIARTGSVLITSAGQSSILTIYPSLHIVVGYTSQVVMEIKDGLQLLRNKYGRTLPSMLCYITGPSRTSDIERNLVIGAQGPKELFVFLIDDLHTESL